MATGTLVSVEEYLNTSYDPDREYVDGEIVERSVGEWDHSRLQVAFASYLYTREKQTGLLAVTGQRVQITPTQFRIPDICVVIGPASGDPIVHTPPFLCIEILSREDRYHAMLEKVDDYLNFGVKYVWVIDPKTRKAHISSASGVTEAKDGLLTTSNPDIRVSLSDL
jgi:Uma2 family endonuclease